MMNFHQKSPEHLARWVETEYFSLLLSENPIVCLYTDGRVYVCFGGDDILLDLNDEAIREMHSILEGW